MTLILKNYVTLFFKYFCLFSFYLLFLFHLAGLLNRYKNKYFFPMYLFLFDPSFPSLYPRCVWRNILMWSISIVHFLAGNILLFNNSTDFLISTIIYIFTTSSSTWFFRKTYNYFLFYISSIPFYLCKGNYYA